MKIDLHTHILPRDWPDLDAKYGYSGFIRLDHYKPCCARMMIGDRVFREITDNVWDPKRRIEECDREKISIQVLSTVPVMFSYWAKAADALDLSRRLNDHIAGVVRNHPGRFAGLATIPLQDPDLAASELERCVRELGLRGAQIGTHVDANPHSGRIDTLNLDNASLQPVWNAAEQLGAAIFVHPWDMFGKERMPKYWLPWLVGMPAETSLAICSMIFGGVFERFPKLRVAFAHGGGAFPFTIGRIEHAFHVRPDLVSMENKTNPRKYLARADKQKITPARFYVDSLVHDAEALRLLLNLFGAERVALGSDYPFPLGEAHPGKLIESIKELSSQEKMRLLSGTAREFLGMDSSHKQHQGHKG
ncbi:MAG TPA: amidohydrolase family protein [Tepidisphaeraceae bacterium]|jgi:aminocarboxymuconate-semialdehyde decarboxylase|nr:amidohydrolase family protein [Tepidisphaeraceae bacterium]